MPHIKSNKQLVNESLKTTVDVIEHGNTSLQGAIKFWCIPITSLSDHLNEKLKVDKFNHCVLTKEKNQVVVAWVLSM